MKKPTLDGYQGSAKDSLKLWLGPQAAATPQPVIQYIP